VHHQLLNLQISGIMNLSSAAHLAARFLRANGFVSFTGARAAFGPTPDMLTYGVAKAAVIHVARSLAASQSMPAGSKTILIAP
jgi:dihydropteridine reductase